jgi:hypothetical protein
VLLSVIILWVITMSVVILSVIKLNVVVLQLSHPRIGIKNKIK